DGRKSESSSESSPPNVVNLETVETSSSSISTTMDIFLTKDVSKLMKDLRIYLLDNFFENLNFTYNLIGENMFVIYLLNVQLIFRWCHTIGELIETFPQRRTYGAQSAPH
ncbi:30341_t:CDS:2, partial [Racocetra persica]